MSTLRWFVLLAWACLAGCGGGGGGTTTRPPSFVVFYSDDHGFADLGIQGVRDDVLTPNIDKLAMDGVLATSAYVTAPQCAPSRAGMLTGIHQNRFGLDDNASGPLRPEQVTIAERLKAAGYVTAMVGKWHLGLDQNNTQNVPAGTDPALFYAANQGFDEYFEGYINDFIASHDAAGHALDHAPAGVHDETYRIDLATQWALSFIRRHHDKPFFLYVPYYAPHVPLEAPQVYQQRFAHVSDATRKIGLSMLSAIDDGVGKIRAELAKDQLSEQTLVVFIGDNGAPLGADWDGSLNDPLIGEKGMLTDGGIRVPFAAAWPGKIPANRVFKSPISTLDVATTLLAAAGIAKPAELEGVDLLPYFNGQLTTLPHSRLFWRWGSQAAVLSEQWKLILLGSQQQLLYDMSAGAPEEADVSAAHPEVVQELQGELSAWAAGLKKPGLPQGPLDAHDKALYQAHGIVP
ncbi:MAG: atsA 28 [Hydrocarboniphaga sp.]|uniref:sulfatase-like hydrolase/transferase n=1 Tax=Hydrocarboniphaga sp. TaxID=2033016 RepID=UPI00263A0AE0|nr:sulfatase-like hydrolase/transferase [Hydrocarboniphaga sp.]MDB5972486.1 atsA 28 [Hydrocarboniphaga sp.]